MMFVNAVTLGTLEGHRDELVATLTQRSDVLRGLGCRLYEVGVSETAPDTVFVVEVWDSAEAHQRSLQHPQVQAAIATARPILSGEFGGFQSTLSDHYETHNPSAATAVPIEDPLSTHHGPGLVKLRHLGETSSRSTCVNLRRQHRHSRPSLRHIR